MNIILFGPPGAGKGTQANNIMKLFKLHKISTGNLLRDEVANNSTLGNKIKSFIDKGSFVPDDVINNLIIKILTNKKFYNRLIFDGYPRNLNQARNLNSLLIKHDQKISCVLSLEVNKEIILKRILGRLSCSKCDLIFNEYFNPPTDKNHKCDPKFLNKRSDDNEKTITKRFDNYVEKTLPILDFYKDLNLLHQVNGMREIDEIFEQIRTILTSLDT